MREVLVHAISVGEGEIPRSVVINALHAIKTPTAVITDPFIDKVLEGARTLWNTSVVSPITVRISFMRGPHVLELAGSDRTYLVEMPNPLTNECEILVTASSPTILQLVDAFHGLKAPGAAYSSSFMKEVIANMGEFLDAAHPSVALKLSFTGDALVMRAQHGGGSKIPLPKLELAGYPLAVGGLSCISVGIPSVEPIVARKPPARETECEECYSTGYWRGFGAPCPKGCRA